MFGPDFYPTPEDVIIKMLQGYDVSGKTILEPSAGKGNIVDYLKREGAEVIACENNTDLLKILTGKCKILRGDFLKVTKEEISHINAIVMNPPFSTDKKHILHAWEIAPDGCTIIALCNNSQFKYTHSDDLGNVIESYGSRIVLQNSFSQAERKTNVEVALIKLQKPAADYETEFNGFFMEEEPTGNGAAGIMGYDAIQDLVSRYVTSVKIFDEQMETARRLNDLTEEYFYIRQERDKPAICLEITAKGLPIKRIEFKKEMQRAGWNWIFEKMNLKKYATRGMKEDINKFIEQQHHIPFTMKNIYQMLNIIVGTQGQQIDKAILEVFDKVTMHYDDNRHHVEGWKTNSHYLLGMKFIFPYMVDSYNWSWNKYKIGPSSSSNYEMIEDLQRAICYITGKNYDKLKSLYSFLRENEIPYGKWATWNYFEIRGYKKGTMHFKFKDEEVWAMFNARVAKLKGYPLFEHVVKKGKPVVEEDNTDESEMEVKPVLQLQAAFEEEQDNF